MKFANIRFLGKNKCNIGDNLQILAIDHLYSYMGISSKEIVYIPYEELDRWKSNTGEKVVLPINFPFLEYKDGGELSRFSPDIIPIYLGLTLQNDELSESDIRYFKNHEPIGCRDEYTYDIMQKSNIHSWLNGCMTISLFMDNKNDRFDGEPDSLYLVDVDNRINEYFFKCKKTVIKSQIVNKSEFESNILGYINNYFYDIKKNASLVVTSRLHCAIPCLALGIPVIICANHISTRFSWVEKLCQIISPDDLIGGKVQIKEKISNDCISHIQHMVLENAAYHLLHMSSSRNYIPFYNYEEQLTKLYSDRVRNLYYREGFDDTICELDSYIENHGTFFGYSFWGLTVLTEMIYNYIARMYPDLKMISIYDRREGLQFHEYTTISSGLITQKTTYDEEVIIVTASAATQEALEYKKMTNNNISFIICYKEGM